MRGAIVAVLLVVLAGCSGSPDLDLPPAGAIRFGTSFNPDTFAVTGSKSTFTPNDRVAMVAAFTSTVRGSVTLEATAGGMITLSQQLAFDGEAGSYAITVAVSQLTFVTGPVEVRFLDVGGNVLASGTLTVG